MAALSTPRFTRLDDWLAWQETLHPRAIDLGLERVREVWRRLHPEALPSVVITVGGTNGKGSCVAFLEAILCAAGYTVGAYTSPHLLRYNERIRLNGQAIDDDALCQAFARIDAARADLSLTYFEFGALAALDLFRQAELAVMVLEVGLGGRLDAVNAVDADAALIASIDLDHMEWLGPDRDAIGYEKAGIYRPDRPAICADPHPPAGLIDQAQTVGARLQLAGRDYHFMRTDLGWRWWNSTLQFDALPLPVLAGDHQLGNAAAVLATLVSLADCLPVSIDAIRAGLTKARIAGRFEVFPGTVEWIMDVAHNPHAARALAANLKDRPCAGQTLAVVGLLADKDAAGVIAALTEVVDHWYTVTLDGPRGRTATDLAMMLQAMGIRATPCADPLAACQSVKAAAKSGDRIVAFGSFHLVAPVLAAQPWSSHDPLSPPREV